VVSPKDRILLIITPDSNEMFGCVCFLINIFMMIFRSFVTPQILYKFISNHCYLKLSYVCIMYRDRKFPHMNLCK
jgi:tetrahydromethanopterin S-methyltransferase subunit E